MTSYKLNVVDVLYFSALVSGVLYALYSVDPFVALFGFIIGSAYLTYLSIFFGVRLYRRYFYKRRSYN